MKLNKDGLDTRNAIINLLVANPTKKFKYKEICVKVWNKYESSAVRNSLIRLESDGVIKVEREQDGVFKINYYRLKEHGSDK